MSTSSSTDALTTLHSTITSSKALLQRYESAIRNRSPSPIDLPLDSPNPLALLSDSVKVLKAQTTKLSLLALNKPFTPSEITRILKSLEQECFPALMIAAELCPIARYTNFLHRIIRSSVGSTMLAFMDLIEDIPTDERGVEKKRGRDTLASTGLIWQSCDFMGQLADLGIIAVASSKVNEYHGLLKDAIAELEEWKNGEVDTEEFAQMQMENKAEKHMPGLFQLHKLNQQILKDNGEDPSVFQFGHTLPINEETKPLVIRVIKTLNLIQMLYPPLLKRRVRRFPSIDAKLKDEDFPDAQQVKSFDALIQFCERFSSEADELAGSLYLLDKGEVEDQLDQLKVLARGCVDRLKGKWDGGEDEFTVWVVKWLKKLEET
ncbi:hypothetical protein MMC14_010722 [Varicellaria rhodocarpa]|nr:hypothetical protein [Varicellaria rhodocarpa]